ncbi:MAG: tripartite tricarboxylate transporter substrate binding protein [Hyphomicrobiales bacterium]|nr:tripartite tricarboxylate transporter substrate binding protein [Hyphomicrobiales bacterium]
MIIVVPYPAGGSTDVLARALASELSKVWKQSVVIENVGGASSIIGSNRVANAAPDGHTLLLTIDPTVVSNRFLFKKLPYDPDKSLAPITMLGRSGQLLIAHPSVTAKDVRALVDAARRNPGGIAYGAYGAGTQPNLLFETLAEREGVKFLHVPYKGIAPVVAAVTAGDVQVSVASPAASGSMVKADKIKALGIGGAKRSSMFPDVPTMREQGFAYIDSVIWWGMFAPGGTSAALVDRIHRDVASIAQKPEFIAKYFTAFGIDPVVDTPAEFATAIRNDVQTTAEMVKAARVDPVE